VFNQFFSLLPNLLFQLAIGWFIAHIKLTEMGIFLLFIQGPIIIIAQALIVRPQGIRKITLSILQQMFDHARLRPTEIYLKPFKDAGNMQPALDHPRATGAVDISPGASLQQLFGVGCGKGRSLQIWTTNACAVQGVMEPVIVEDRSQDTVFDIIQADLFALNGEQFGIPGTVAEKARRDQAYSP
jgi:hypothetical protein